MGIHREDGRLFLRIFNSTTFTNILANPKAAANIVDDPALLVKSALSDVEPERYKFIDGFPVIKQALGWIIFDCECRRGENTSVVELSPVRGKINRRLIKPVNRGFNAVIEAAIHATRYVGLKEEEYLRQIGYCNTIVQKCGGAHEKEAMRLLYELIGYTE
jgi:hypothetical protein